MKGNSSKSRLELEIPVVQIRSDEVKTRDLDDEHVEELMASFETKGQRQPIEVRPTGGGYKVTFGEHRLEAAKRLTAIGKAIKGLPVGTIKGIIQEADEHEALELKVTENAQRNTFVNPWKEGEIFARLLREKYHGDINALAGSIGKRTAYIKERTAVYYRLDPSLVPMIGKGLTVANAIKLATYETREQLELARALIGSRVNDSLQYGSSGSGGGGWRSAGGRTTVRVMCTCKECGNIHPKPEVQIVLEE